MPKSPEGGMFRKTERPEDIEARIEEMLSTLPEDLQMHWEEEYAETELAEQERTLKELIAKREQALSSPSANVRERPQHAPIEQRHPLAVANLIERLDEGSRVLLGKGNAAHVISSVRNEGACYKVMLPKESLPAGTNSIAREVDLQEEIANLGEIAGVRAPKVYSFVEDGEVRAIMMERLDAVSFDDILIYNKEPFPEAFDSKKFFDALTEYIELLHSKNYYHRDLHGGNVLIDRKTGMPYVVDFGFTTRTFGEENPYHAKFVEAGQNKERVLPSDEGCIKNLKRLVASHGGV